MRLKLVILTILSVSLTACSGLRYVPEGSRICPDRIWMASEAKTWLRQNVVEVTSGVEKFTGASLPFRVYLTLITQQQRRLDVCNGLDPERASPVVERLG